MTLALALAVAMGVTGPSSAQIDAHQVSSKIEACEARAHAEGRLPLGCLREVSRGSDPAARAVRAYLEEHAESAADPRWRLALGLAWLTVDDARAEAMLVRAASELEELEDAEGEVHARLALARYHSVRAQPDPSRAQRARVSELAEIHDDDLWRAMALIEAASAARDGYGDLALARRQLERAQELLPADASPRLRARVLSNLGGLASAAGDLHGARDFARRSAELLAASHDAFGHAEAVHEALLLEATLYERAYADWPPDLRERARHAMLDARRSGNAYAESLLSCLLGDLTRVPAEQIVWLERCVELRRRAGFTFDTARLRLARRLARDPTRAHEASAMLDEIVASATAVADPWTEASALDARAGLRWHFGDQGGALADWERHFAVIETIRNRQPDDEVEQGIFEHWAPDYLRVSGLLLSDLGRREQYLPLAFDVMERLRARQLLDALDDGGITRVRRFDDEVARRRRDTQLRAHTLAERLATPTLVAAERDELLEQLAQLDAEEQALRLRLAERDPSFARTIQPRLATLAQVQRSLADEQAVFAYQVSFDRGPRDRAWGGSWLVAITRARVHVYPLPSEERLVPAVRRYVADLGARDGREIAAGQRLHAWLLAPALADLPPEVDELVIIPDHALHALPFAALVGPAGPLAVDFEVSRAPSVTTWMELRRGDEPVERSLLALADPQPLPVGAGIAAARPLPGARLEARAAVSVIGGNSELWLGAIASEARLRAVDPRRFAILHLGAHTVINDARPEQSAVWLTAGQGQDGALHPHELGALSLEGKLVVLAACQGAGGRRMGGEGPLGPARAAFLAGARTVVASLWPVRDDEALEFFSRFYLELGQGKTVGEAVAGARRSMIEQGKEARAWAGFVVIGDAGLRVERGSPAVGRWALAGVLLALAGLGVARFVRGGPSPGPRSWQAE